MTRMLKDKDGDRVEAVYWDDEDGTCCNFSDVFKEKAYLSHEYYGDHSENWIIVLDVNTSKEVRRFNTTKLGTIIWWIDE